MDKDYNTQQEVNKLLTELLKISEQLQLHSLSAAHPGNIKGVWRQRMQLTKRRVEIMHKLDEFTKTDKS